MNCIRRVTADSSRAIPISIPNVRAAAKRPRLAYRYGQSIRRSRVFDAHPRPDRFLRRHHVRRDNIAHAAIDGVELTHTWHVSDWTLDQRHLAESAGSGRDKQLVRRPKESSTRSSTRIGDRLHAGVEFFASGKRDDVGGVTLPGYALINLRASYDIAATWSVVCAWKTCSIAATRSCTATTRRGAPIRAIGLATTVIEGLRGLGPAVPAIAGRNVTRGIESALCELILGQAMNEPKTGAGVPAPVAHARVLLTLASRGDLPPRARQLLEGVLAICSSTLEKTLLPRSTISKRSCSASPSRAATTISNTGISKRCARSNAAAPMSRRAA